MQTCGDFTINFHVTIQEDHQLGFPERFVLALETQFHCCRTSQTLQSSDPLELECTKFNHKFGRGRETGVRDERPARCRASDRLRRRAERARERRGRATRWHPSPASRLEQCTRQIWRRLDRTVVTWR